MKRIFIFLLTLALAFGLVACGGDTPDEPCGPEEQAPLGKTTITVLTPAGAAIPGVFVFVYDGAGNATGYAKTDSNGKASFELNGTGYTVSLDGLPAGYVAEPSYNLNSSDFKITVKTELIPENQGAPSYKVGDVMQDFTFTDCYGNVVKLSDILKEKEAVVINYWFIGCKICNQEFPFLNEAYTQYSDKIELLGVNIEASDTNAKIAAHKESYLLAFPMGHENCNTFEKFGFEGAPGTVIIDSDGIVRYRHEGPIMTTAEWCEIFDSVLG